MKMMLLGIVFSLSTVALTEAHGYLKVPAARNCMWRFGFRNPPNYNDNELYCGGFSVMHKQNGGRCGICGDPWHSKYQRHMDGGRYANNIIAKTYRRGQIATFEVKLTASHKGFFQFRVGDFTNKRTEGDAYGRLRGYLIHVLDGKLPDKTKFKVTGSGSQLFRIRVQLPSNLMCKRCVVQWWYTAGNNWGNGPQETFVNCADITITP